jgi:tRNA pseudouridine55 synthase
MKTQSNNDGGNSNLPVHGLLLLNKPAGLTSNRALQKVKRLLRASKAGHTGSLDPAATGMLPLCFGEATKVCAYLLNADKTYRVSARLGEKTDTGDADGQVIETASVPAMTKLDWESVIDRFIGETQQIPPMYSALKVDGKRLYELARKGQVVDRKPRTIRIDELTLLECKGARLVLRVKCSKGTYIRTLVEDIAAAAGTIAHTDSLHRESVGSFRAEDMLDLSKAEEWAESAPELLRERLLAPDIALAEMPPVEIREDQSARFVQGQQLEVSDAANGEVRVYGEKGQFLGVGELIGNGKLAPRRVFNI